MNAKVTETIHPKAVGVLAVLDDAISEFSDLRVTDRHGIGPALIEAHAAVAELIDAARKLHIITAGLQRDIDVNERRALELVLDRVQGGAK